jgi:hypothetical protein
MRRHFDFGKSPSRAKNLAIKAAPAPTHLHPRIVSETRLSLEDPGQTRCSEAQANSRSHLAEATTVLRPLAFALFTETLALVAERV